MGIEKKGFFGLYCRLVGYFLFEPELLFIIE